MTFKEYVKFTYEWEKPYQDWDKLKVLFVITTGLAGESGEAIEHVKKYVRDDGRLDVTDFKLELGDVLHYWMRLLNYFGYDPEEIMEMNFEKLSVKKAKHDKK